MGGFNPFKNIGATLANAAATFVMSGGNWFAVAASIASTMFQQAIAPKPSIPNFSGNFDIQAQQDRILSFRNAVTTRKLVYGEIKVGGPIVFISTTKDGSLKNGFLHMVVVHASHEIQSFEGWYINGREVPLGSVSGGASGGTVNAGDFDGLVRINPHLGSNTQVADNDLVSECAEWSSEHKLSGMAYTYFRFKFDSEKFQGTPDVAAKVKGKKIYDTRTGSTAYSANPALVIRDYMTTELGMNLAPALVDATKITSAANICDESVSLKDAGTEKRYECHGMVDTANKVSSNLEELLTSMSGSLVYSNGKFKISAGAAVTPVFYFSEKDVVGRVNVTPRMSRRENFNAVKGKYISEINDWQSSDYPPIESATFKAEDNGELIFRDFTLPYTTSSSMAQRISKIALFVNRQPLMFSATFSLAALGIDVGDTCYISQDRYGWDNKQFQCLSWNFVIGEDELAIQMELKEYSANSYDWSTTEEEVLTATPNTVIPNVFDIDPPTNISVTEEMRETRDSRGVQSVLVTTFDSSFDAFVLQYESEYKKSTDTAYTSIGTSSAQKFEILDVAAAVYDIRIRALTSLGSTSDFVTAQFSADGLTAAPSAMADLTVNQVGGMAFLQWSQTADLDVKIGGKVEVRFQPVTTGASLVNSLVLDDSIAGSATSAMVPLRTGTYLLRFIDSSGNAQSSPTSVVSDGATILAFTTASTITESPSFSGTKTDLMKTDANELQLSSGVLIDSVTDFDAVSNFDLLGAINSTGNYVFASNMDLTAVKRVRLSTSLTSNIFNALDNVDDRTANIDTWSDFDGTQAAVGNIEMYYAVTDDNPASGSASWSSYKPFTQTEEQGRGFKYKAIFTTEDVAYNIKCTAMSVTAATI
jgi:hypothetical protein